MLTSMGHSNTVCSPWGWKGKLLKINSIVDWYLSWMAQVVRALSRKAKGPGSSPGPSTAVGQATEGLENELWRRWSDGKVGECALLCVLSCVVCGGESGIVLTTDFRKARPYLSRILVQSLWSPKDIWSTGWSKSFIEGREQMKKKMKKKWRRRKEE